MVKCFDEFGICKLSFVEFGNFDVYMGAGNDECVRPEKG
jgi:hypothetical protein